MFAAVAVAAIVASATTPAPPLLVWNVGWIAAAACALAGMLAARRSVIGTMRTRWTLWVAATACWLVGQLVWDLLVLLEAWQSPNPADAAWWAYAVLVIAGLLPSVPGARAVRLVAIVEALPLIAAAMALTYAELWDHVATSALPAASQVSTLAYPAIYVSAAVLTLQAMVGGGLRSARSPGLHLVLGGIVAQAAAFIFWSEQLLDQRYVVGASLVDPLWVVGMVAIGAGGALSARTPEPETATIDEPGHWSVVLPAATFMLLVAALVAGEVEDRPLAPQLVLAGGLLICGAMLISRGIILEHRLRGLLRGEQTARAALSLREGELARVNMRLAEDSRRDALTGLLNRRALADDLQPDTGLRAGEHESLAVALCDVDRFKAYNDRLGHLAGDRALRALAATVLRELRTTDRAYRFGGEELLLVLRTGPADAVAITERVRAAVAAMQLPHPGGIDGILTVSIGVAAGAGDVNELLAAADAALYAAKAAGRNRVETADSDHASHQLRARVAETLDASSLRHPPGG